jgi:hypothetical protein
MNIELSLLATMAYHGDFSPIVRGDIVQEHFETEQGKILFNFICNYRKDTGGTAVYPSLKTIRKRFAKASMELPDPDPGDTVAALAFETRLERFRSELRQLATNAGQIADTSSDPFGDTMPLIHELRRAAEQTQKVDHMSFANGFKVVSDNYKNKEIIPDGIPWPWPTMTKETKGLQKQECIAIVGRPKSRKTFTALRVGTHAVKAHGKRVLIFTPEMPVRQIFLRCVAHLCDLPYREFKNAQMQEAEEARLFAAAQAYYRMPDCEDWLYHMQMQELFPDLEEGQLPPSLDIVMSTGKDVMWMAGQIEIFRPDLVIIDSFYKHRGQGQKKNDADWRAMVTISREMKELAMQQNIPIILTSQLNREAQKSIGDLSNISFTDAIGQDMDGIYRVITGKAEGHDVSALISYAHRDVAFEGILIRNEPCWDYSEIGLITNRKIVSDLLKQEDETASKEEAERLKEKIRAGGAVATASDKPAFQGATKTRRSPLANTKPFRLRGHGALHSELAENMRAATVT